MSKKLTFWVFYHRNEPSEFKDDLLARIGDHWKREMSQLTDAEIQIVSTEGYVKTISDFEYYSAPPQTCLEVFERQIEALSRDGRYTAPGLNKYLLLTGNPLLATPTGGVSRLQGKAAIASPQTGDYCLAREAGHLLGASFEGTHVEHVEGRFMDAYMHPTTEYRRAKLYRYNEENRQQITAYLNDQFS